MEVLHTPRMINLLRYKGSVKYNARLTGGGRHMMIPQMVADFEADQGLCDGGAWTWTDQEGKNSVPPTPHQTILLQLGCQKLEFVPRDLPSPDKLVDRP